MATEQRGETGGVAKSELHNVYWDSSSYPGFRRGSNVVRVLDATPFDPPAHSFEIWKASGVEKFGTVKSILSRLENRHSLVRRTAPGFYVRAETPRVGGTRRRVARLHNLRLILKAEDIATAPEWKEGGGGPPVMQWLQKLQPGLQSVALGATQCNCRFTGDGKAHVSLPLSPQRTLSLMGSPNWTVEVELATTDLPPTIPEGYAILQTVDALLGLGLDRYPWRFTCEINSDRQVRAAQPPGMWTFTWKEFEEVALDHYPHGELARDEWKPTKGSYSFGDIVAVVEGTHESLVAQRNLKAFREVAREFPLIRERMDDILVTRNELESLKRRVQKLGHLGRGKSR